MKEKEFLRSFIKIADIHASRLRIASAAIMPLHPMTVAKFSQMDEHQLAFFDMMTTRFSKLQDVIGAKIFPLILSILGEDAPAFIDKLNKLEKLDYIDDANWWMNLREIRNQITHDYPDDYEVLTKHFNTFAVKANELLVFWGALKSKAENLCGL